MTDYTAEQLDELCGTFSNRAFDALEKNDQVTAHSNFTKALNITFQIVAIAGADKSLLWSARSRQAMLYYFLGDTKKAEELAKYIVKEVTETFLAPMVLFWISLDKAGKGGPNIQTGSLATDIGIGAFNWIRGNQKVNEAKDKAAAVINGYAACIQAADLDFEWLQSMTSMLIESVAPFLENVKDTRKLQALYQCVVRAPWARFTGLTQEQTVQRDELLMTAQGALRRLS